MKQAKGSGEKREGLRFEREVLIGAELVMRTGAVAKNERMAGVGADVNGI